jgi:hypothetical protein
MSIVESTSAHASAVPLTFPDAGLQAVLPALRQIAMEIFGEPVRMEVECDPEIDDSCYVVFSVVLKVEISQAMPLRLEWYRRTEPLLVNRLDQVVLSIDVPE